MTFGGWGGGGGGGVQVVAARIVTKWYFSDFNVKQLYPM